MGKEEDVMALANRLGVWVAMAALFVYVLNIGQWVGAADNKLEKAEEVEKTQQSIKERLTRLEETVQANDDKSAVRDQEILKAIERLERKLEEDDG